MNIDKGDFAMAQGDYLEGVRNRRVFTTSHLILGMPANIAIGGAALAVAVFLIATWWAGLLVALVYFPPMITIHKDDVRAFQVWQSTLKETTLGWEAGHTARRALVILRD